MVLLDGKPQDGSGEIVDPLRPSWLSRNKVFTRWRAAPLAM